MTMTNDFFTRELPERKLGDKVVDGILKKEFIIVGILQELVDGKISTSYILDIPLGTLDENYCDHGEVRNPYECFDGFDDPYLKTFVY